MKKIILAFFSVAIFSIFVFALLFSSAAVFAQTAPQVQTNPATNFYSNQATLNGYFSGNNFCNNNYNNYYIYNNCSNTNVWFQWGIDTNYGNTTPQLSLSSANNFSQTITGLSQNTTYHFRAVGSNYANNNANIYGQDMTFYTGNFNNNYNNNYYNNYYGNGTLTVTKQVINLTSGNLNWQSSVNANPGDILSFAITMQANGQDIHNVFLRDNLPANLIYRGNMTLNTSVNYLGSPMSGINIGTIPAGGVEIISYQVQVSPTNYSYTNTTASNLATVTSSEAGTQTASATVLVNNSVISPIVNPIIYTQPTYISTGLTNNPITDSFFLPLFLIILGAWFYFSGKIYVFADWLRGRTSKTSK